GMAPRFPASLLISCHRGVRPSPPYHHPQREDIGDSDHREYHSRSLPGIVYIDYFVLRKIKYDARIRAPTAICPRRAGGPSGGGGRGGAGLCVDAPFPPPSSAASHSPSPATACAGSSSSSSSYIPAR